MSGLEQASGDMDKEKEREIKQRIAELTEQQKQLLVALNNDSKGREHHLNRAKDRAAALAQVYGRGGLDIFPYDPEALVERGELVPRSIVAGRELGEKFEDLSEQAEL
jgi:hypothetical protein